MVQASDERNYHIFYCMLAGLSKEEKSRLEVQDASKFYYLTQGGRITCEGRDDAAEFADIRSAMKVLMFSDSEIWEVLKILSAVLHLGNIKYKGKLSSFAFLPPYYLFHHNSSGLINYQL